MKLGRKKTMQRIRNRGKCATVKSKDLKPAPPGDRGACERPSKSHGSE